MGTIAEQTSAVIRRGAQLVLALGVGILCAIHSFRIYQLHRQQSEFLFWDPAEHAYWGVRIAEDIKNLKLASLLADTNLQALWPPLHSYLQLPFMLWFGSSFYASSICSMFFLALVFPAIVYCYQQRSVSWSGWLVLVLLIATSPMYAAFGTMPMIEIAGAGFSALALALYLKRSKYFPVALALLFFLKYNYCLFLLLPVATLEGIRWLKEPVNRATFRRLVRSPFAIFVAASLAVMTAILLSGGFKVAGIKVRGIGNPLYVLFVVAIVRIVWKWGPSQCWRFLVESGWAPFVVPVLIWLLIPVPNRVKTLVSFAISAPSGLHATQPAYYMFYVKSLPAYFSSPWVAAACVVSAIVSLLRKRIKEEAAVALFFVLPFLLITLNQNKQERFLFTFVSGLWLLCAFAVSRVPLKWLRAGTAVALSIGSLVAADPSATDRLIAWPFVTDAVQAPVHYIADTGAQVNRICVLGTSNEMSPALVAYHMSRVSGFKRWPRIYWRLDDVPRRQTDLMAINRGGPGTWLSSRNFPGEVAIHHYLLTP